MQTTSSVAPVITCAENIALLQFLHDVPMQPILRDLSQPSRDVPSSVLSLEQERRLTSILAILSGIREDTNHVTAIAVRETSHPEALEVLVAINKANERDGNQYLADIKTALNCIFDTLREANDAYHIELELKVFAKIVEACRERILSRLRFRRHKRGKQRRPLHERLQVLVEVISTLKTIDTGRFIDVTRKLIAVLKSFSKHQVIPELVKVVEEAHSWTQLGDMTTIFTSVPNKVLGPTEYPGLRDIIWKVGQYRTAARRLYRMTRDAKILRDVTVTPISLGSEAFSRIDLDNYEPNLAANIDRVKEGDKKPGLMTELCRYLQKDAAKAQRDFSTAVSRNLKSSKIHAEVQVLVHLQSSSQMASSMPRIVQSNKKACYFCDQLFMVDDTLIIPKSHGKLYEGWRLPLLPGLKALQIQFNKAMENQARKSITMVLRKKTKISYPDPYESSALSMSAQTVTGEAPVAVEQRLESPPASSNQPDDTPLRQLDNQRNGESKAGDFKSDSLRDFTKAEKAPNGDQCHSVASDSPRAAVNYLRPGHVSSAYEGAKSTLWIEYSIGPDYAQSAKPLIYSVRSLGVDEISVLKAQRTSEIVDCTVVDPGSEVSLAQHQRYHIDLGDAIFELVLQS